MDRDGEEKRESRFEKLDGFESPSDYESDDVTDDYLADDDILEAESKQPTIGRFQLLQDPSEFEELDSANEKVEQTLRKSPVSSLRREDVMELVHEMHNLRKEVLKLQDKVFCDKEKRPAGRKIEDELSPLRLRL